MPVKRYLQDDIARDLGQKMVFLAGPRQVGKTTLAKEVMQEAGAGVYYLWDSREDRQSILKSQWPAEPCTVVLDELHKYRKWKQWIKGEWDKNKDRIRFLVTGSARMDVYRRGGDSLQGRYHHYRLHPFSLKELLGEGLLPFPPEALKFSASADFSLLETLWTYSGFPEPLLAKSENEHRRWQKERLERFFREDVRDLENIRDLSSMQILADLIPQRVGSPLSINSLREDLDVSHRAVDHWMGVFERLYYLFTLRPFSAKKIRSLKKEPKVYLWDWSLVENPGARFENLMASHLLKFCHFLEDRAGYRMELHYLRDLEKREVDFLVAVKGRPWFAVEAKLSEEEASPSLSYFGERLKIPFLFQVSYRGDRDFIDNGVRVMPASKFLTGLV